jgi:hypothetical protein
MTSPLEIQYEVRRSDFIWMYLRSRAGMSSLLPGALFILIGVAVLPDPKYSVGDGLWFIVAGLAFLVLAPAYYFWLLAGMGGIKRVIGTRVHLRLDEDGITGWPLAATWEETTWRRLRKSWHLRGVRGLPFGGASTRRAWIPIPDRALSPEMRDKLGEMLSAHYASRGVSRIEMAEAPFMPRTVAESKLVPSIVIARSGLWKRFGYPPIRMGDSWIQAPIHPLFRWDEIARIDADPKRPNSLRLWTYAGGTNRSEINKFPLNVRLTSYEMAPREVESTIKRQFESWRSKSATASRTPDVEPIEPMGESEKRLEGP